MNNNPYTQDEYQQNANYPSPYNNNASHWEFQRDGYYASGPIMPPPPEKKKAGNGSKVLSTIALVLACGLSGFGGGVLAVTAFGPHPDETVLYKSEGGQTGITNTSEGGNASISVAAAAGRSVVSIVTENLVSDPFTGGRIVSGAGSGVIVSSDGTILTNNHVVEGAKNITVTLPDGTDYPAKLVGVDPRTDMAVIKIEATGLTPAVIGNSDELQVGEPVLAIGNPMGTLSGTVTDGIISAMNREVRFDDVTMNLLQMSAAVSPGNSGGGLFNNQGELIGIVNAKSSGQGAEGLGFAIPSNTAMQVAQELIENGHVSRPAIGINVFTFGTEQEAKQSGFDKAGVYIIGVTPGSGAEKAGLEAGDRIIAVDGTEVGDSADVSAAIAEKKVGDSLQLRIERKQKTMEVNVELGEMTA